MDENIHMFKITETIDAYILNKGVISNGDSIENIYKQAELLRTIATENQQYEVAANARVAQKMAIDAGGDRFDLTTRTQFMKEEILILQSLRAKPEKYKEVVSDVVTYGKRIHGRKVAEFQKRYTTE
ncbi:MAG TPA: hypothetical protein VGF14_04875 [Alphaproteobacteria bacterium]